MSTTPRTPVHFPRMKHRAAGRAIRKQRREMRSVIHAFAEAAKAVEAFVNEVGIAFNAWQKAFLADALAHQEKSDAR